MVVPDSVRSLNFSQFSNFSRLTLHHLAAIDADDLSVYVPGHVGAEEKNHASDVIRLTQST